MYIIDYLKSFCKSQIDPKNKLIKEMNKRNQLLEDEIRSMKVKLDNKEECFRCYDKINETKTNLNYFCNEACTYGNTITHYYCNRVECYLAYIHILEDLF